MIEVTFTGETLDDVLSQIANFAVAHGFAVTAGDTSAPAEVQTQTAEKTTGPSQVDPPKKTRKAKAGEKKTEAQIAAELPGESIVGADDAEEEFDAVAAAGVKEQALDKIRAVYALGSEGMEAVKKLGKKYEVKKLGDVPLPKAADLLKDIEAIEKKLAKDSPV